MDGSTQKQQRGGKKLRKMNSLQVDFIKNLFDENCTLTLKQIKESINAEFKKNVSVGTIHKYVSDFGYSFKRVASVAAVSLLDESREVRKAYATWFLKINNSNRHIIFYDETGFQVVMRNTYGRSLKRKKAIFSVPSIK